MKTLIIVTQICIIFSISILSIAADNSSIARYNESTPWEKVKEHDGISIYTRHDKGSDGTPYASFRGVGNIEVNDLYSLVAVLEDHKSIPDWLALVSSIQEIDRDNYFKRYMHALVKLPIISDRDLVIKLSVSQNPKTEAIHVTLKNKYDYIPFEPSHIRIPVFEGLLHFRILSPTLVELTYEVAINIGGNLKQLAIIDYLTMLTPYLTIKNFRESVKNPKYHNLQTESSELQFHPNNH